jgi:hypothetical protein
LEEYDLDIARASLLESIGRLADAAELHLTEGRPLEAIGLFLKDSANEAMLCRGRECILEGLWQNLSFAVNANSVRENETLDQLLSLAANFDTSHLGSGLLDEVRQK